MLICTYLHAQSCCQSRKMSIARCVMDLGVGRCVWRVPCFNSCLDSLPRNAQRCHVSRMRSVPTAIFPYSLADACRLAGPAIRSASAFDSLRRLGILLSYMMAAKGQNQGQRASTVPKSPTVARHSSINAAHVGCSQIAT